MAVVGTTEYNIWKSMIQRCYYERRKDFPNYGGRGIKVCERWKGRGKFKNFLSDMGMRPNKKHTLDRIDNDGDYSPENCRWATLSQKHRNYRQNVIVDGKCIQQIHEETGINRQTLYWRAKNKRPLFQIA